MGIRQRFTVLVENRGSVAHITPSGELDLAGIPLLEQTMANLRGGSIAHIVVELSEMTFIDSSGVHALVDAEARARANGQTMVVFGASPMLRRITKIIGAESLLEGAAPISWETEKVAVNG